MQKKVVKPLWSEGEDADFGKFAISYAGGEDIYWDRYFITYECLTNQAHVVMLVRQNLLEGKKGAMILSELEKIKDLDKKGKYFLKKELEDVHGNIEHHLIEKLGENTGGWMRLGIARNDQVYTDTRMYIRDKLIIISKMLTSLIESINVEAGKSLFTVMPGYTHFRISQPITYAHYLMSKSYHFYDDLVNILKDFDIINKCPLGIFEMAGTGLSIDRNLTAKLLGFSHSTSNSLYTANQRGELEINILSDLTILATHIRRLMAEIILFSSCEFELLEIDDLYTSGGTAQPNLKNPDTLEAVRANMGKISGYLAQTISIMDMLSLIHI